MKRFYYITFLLLIGFFLIPMESYACGTESEKIEISCNDQTDSEVEKKESCDKEKEQCDKHEKDCNGKCGNPDCHCPTNCTYFVVSSFAYIQFSQTKMIVSKSKFYYQEAYYPSGFLSIWLPPKIS